MDALLVLLCMASAWWLAWRTVGRLAGQKSWGSFARKAACTATACLASFSAFCISGGLLLPDPTNGGPAVAGLGVLLSASLVFALWRASRPAKQLANTTSVVQRPDDQVAPVLQSLGSTSDLPLLPREFLFSYTDHEGQSSRRRVRVMGIASNDGRQYLDGYCLDRNAMRTFRVDRILGEMTDAETGELVNVYRLLAGTDKRRHMDYAPPKAEFSWSEAGEEFDHVEAPTTVLFTGFAKARKQELEAMAEAAGWEVRSTVSQSLDYLVCGPKAGPAKVSKANQLGLLMLDENKFQSLVS